MEAIESVSVALEKKGSFLIIKRSESGYRPGIWEFPSGRRDPGEHLKTTAIREVLEETGLEVRDIQFIGRSVRMAEGTPRHIHHYYSDSFSGRLVLSYEHSDSRWATKKDILREPNIGNDTTKFFDLWKV